VGATEVEEEEEAVTRTVVMIGTETEEGTGGTEMVVVEMTVSTVGIGKEVEGTSGAIVIKETTGGIVTVITGGTKIAETEIEVEAGAEAETVVIDGTAIARALAETMIEIAGERGMEKARRTEQRGMIGTGRSVTEMIELKGCKGSGATCIPTYMCACMLEIESDGIGFCTSPTSYLIDQCAQAVLHA
jgi:hypothetical protein